MVYVSSDWHGIPFEKIQRLLSKAGFGADDRLYVLGDVIDRGEHGVELIKRIMHEPNMRLIRGNHEQMLLGCDFIFEEITEQSVDAVRAERMRWLRIWQANGAEPTIAGLSRESHEMRRRILAYLYSTPLYKTVSVGKRDYVLVHAGLGVSACEKDDGSIECSEDDLLWTRPYLTTRYSGGFTTVLGHTPTYFYGERYKGKILKTSTWIDVDTGAAAGLMPALLRLDDLQEFYLND